MGNGIRGALRVPRYEYIGNINAICRNILGFKNGTVDLLEYSSVSERASRKKDTHAHRKDRCRLHGLYGLGANPPNIPLLLAPRSIGVVRLLSPF